MKECWCGCHHKWGSNGRHSVANWKLYWLRGGTYPLSAEERTIVQEAKRLLKLLEERG